MHNYVISYMWEYGLIHHVFTKATNYVDAYLNCDMISELLAEEKLDAGPDFSPPEFETYEDVEGYFLAIYKLKLAIDIIPE